MHDEVDDECYSRGEVPSLEGGWERQLRRDAAAPVHDPRDEHVQRDDEEQEIGDRKADPPFDQRLGSRTSWVTIRADGPPALGQVHQHQPDEDQPDDGVVGDPHMKKLERAERGRGRVQETEMDRPAGSGPPRRPAGGRPLSSDSPSCGPSWNGFLRGSWVPRLFKTGAS